LINCLCQFWVACTATVALVLTYRQFSGKAKARLKAKIRFFIGEKQNNEFFVAIRISVVNLGMAPVYISETGIQLWDGNRKKWSMCTSLDPIVIKPGNIVHVSGEYDFEMMEDHATLHDRVSVYAKCQLDRCWIDKERVSYAEFNHEYEKVKRSLPENNR
jgi:hypothetical protein